MNSCNFTPSTPLPVALEYNAMCLVCLVFRRWSQPVWKIQLPPHLSIFTSSLIFNIPTGSFIKPPPQQTQADPKVPFTAFYYTAVYCAVPVPSPSFALNSENGVWGNSTLTLPSKLSLFNSGLFRFFSFPFLYLSTFHFYIIVYKMYHSEQFTITYFWILIAYYKRLVSLNFLHLSIEKRVL